MRNKLQRFFAALFTLVLITTVGAWAQAGKIEGKVVDAETGEALIGANVVIQGTTKGASTDIDGNYLILNVAPGTYTLEARYIGYTSTIVKEVIVRTDLTTKQNFELRPESFEGEEIVVTAKREVIIKDLTSSESRVSSEEINKLPVQEVGDVLQLQSGVNQGDDGALRIRGGRASEVSYVVDGIRVTDDYDRGQGLRLENQAVQELQVISGTFNAEHGQAMSGVVNVVTKAGDNEFEGNVQMFSGSYMINDTQIYDNMPNSLLDFEPTGELNFQASLSGPIIKDKLTFFVNGRVFDTQGYQRGRNAFSPHNRFVDTLGASQFEMDGTRIVGYRTLYNEEVDLANPWYSADTTIIGGRRRVILTDDGTRDSSIVYMDDFRSYSLQSNIQFKPTQSLKFNILANYGRNEGNQGYSHFHKLVPLGRAPNLNENYSLNLKTTITPSNNTFITANVAYRLNSFEESLYDSPYDPRYFNFDNRARFSIPNPGQNQFIEYGTSNSFIDRTTESFIAKAEISSQVNDHHFVKGGINFQGDIVNYSNFSLVPLDPGQGVTLPDDIPQEQRQFLELGIPQPDNPANIQFENRPFNLIAYIQDKIEFDELTINAGLRLDYFDANARIPADPSDPDITNPISPDNRWNDSDESGIIEQDERTDANLTTREQRESYWWEDVDAKWQLSPRIGIAYAISDRGVMHFSYGYFFQMPTYQFLYERSQRFLVQQSGIYGPFGNPDLDPERTIQYEIGWKQEIFDGTGLEITGFYKDSRDYVSTGNIILTANPEIKYGTYINRDFAKSRGFTVTINQNLGRALSFNLDYTYTSVEGTNSDPAAEFARILATGTDDDVDGLVKLVQPLNWDRRHIINTSLFYGFKGFNGSIVGRVLTGEPYTPSSPAQQLSGPVASARNLVNTARLPGRFTLDLNLAKTFNLGTYDVNVFANVFNVLNSEIVTGVFSDSGEPDGPLPIQNQVANADPTFFDNPANYGRPRRIQIGINVTF